MKNFLLIIIVLSWVESYSQSWSDAHGPGDRLATQWCPLCRPWK